MSGSKIQDCAISPSVVCRFALLSLSKILVVCIHIISPHYLIYGIFEKDKRKFVNKKSSWKVEAREDEIARPDARKERRKREREHENPNYL